MSTNAIGTGTCNISINLPVDERSILGRLAFRMGFRSVGELNRHLIEAGLEKVDPQAAQEVKEIRRRYYGAAMLGAFLLAVVWGHDEARRPSSRVRTGRSVEERVEEA
jgi:hypothetical protein